MNQDVGKYVAREICRLDVETPLGVVHLAGFAQKPDHRSVVLNILSDYVGEVVTAADIVESKENTRPRFPKLDFDVNWTHSDGYCVCAYGARGSKGAVNIGVDLERFSPKRLHLAERFFSSEESSLVGGLEGDAAQVAFFRLWSRKEAFYKCVGGEFFEGTLRRPMLEDRVCVQGETVYLVDVDRAAVGMPVPASLCVAVCSTVF